MERHTRCWRLIAREAAAPGSMTDDLCQKCGLWLAKDLEIIDLGGNNCAV